MGVDCDWPRVMAKERVRIEESSQGATHRETDRRIEVCETDGCFN